jgi:hypothetical protein
MITIKSAVNRQNGGNKERIADLGGGERNAVWLNVSEHGGG